LKWKKTNEDRKRDRMRMRKDKDESEEGILKIESLLESNNYVLNYQH